MATSNAPGLVVPAAAQRQLKALLSNIDRVEEIIDRSANVKAGVTAYEVLQPLAGQLNIDHGTLLDIFYALENLRRLETEYGTPGEVLERIFAGTEPQLAKQLMENKARILEIFAGYKADNPVALSFKAQKLAYLHERIFRDADILTDIRPIFNEAGEAVLSAIIGQTLTITFTRVGATERIHLALDAGDVLGLRKACDRAILKAKVLQASFASSKLNWDVHVLRGDDDGIG
jgi:hypothetical protein